MRRESSEQWRKILRIVYVYIGDSEYKSLLSTDGILPRAYGLPKIHKQGCPLRVIVSSLNSTLYKIAVFLHYVIYNNIQPPTSNIENSTQLVERDVNLDPNYHLVSLDVISLFTNISTLLLIVLLRDRILFLRGPL